MSDIGRLELLVLALVEAKRHRVAAYQDRPPDEIWLTHHQVDRLFLRPGQRTLLEDRAAGADEVQESIRVDVAFEERSIRRLLVDVAFNDVDAVLSQKTSGVPACRSRRLPEKGRLGHPTIVDRVHWYD